MSKRTLGSVLDTSGGVGPGFDFLRIALALAIVAWHSVGVAYGDLLDHIRVVWLPGYALITMFFALSGFLIAGSAQRLTLQNFLTNRGLRIFPALGLEVILSAFVLGALFTTLPLSAYFTNGETYSYLTNILGRINWTLPGVFENNNSHTINFSLWTVPFELRCYLIISLLMIFGGLKRAWLPAVLAIAAVFVGIALTLHQAGDGFVGTIERGFGTNLVGPGSRLYVAFLLGIAGYLMRDRIPYDPRFFVGALAGCALISLLQPADWLSFPLLNLLLAPLCVYICLFIGVSKVPPLPFFHRGDYSYGIYLYGVPIQQAVWAALPFTRTPLLNFLVAAPLIVLFAVFSWHVVEKPILKLRRKFSFVARARGVGDESPKPTTLAANGTVTA